MRIWIIHQHAIPPILMGPTRHYDLAKVLIEQGHEVLILAGNYCHNHFRFIAEPFSMTKKMMVYSAVPFMWVGVPAYKKNSLKRLFNMLIFAYKIMRNRDLEHLPKPNIILGSSPSPLAAYAAYKLARRYKVPFLYEIRDLWPKTLLKLGKFSKKHPLVRIFQFIEDTLLRKAAGVISVLPGVKEYLQEKIPPEKFIWLPNAVDVDKIYCRPLRKNCSPITVVYAGAFNISNDLEAILHAANLLQTYDRIEFKFQLIGDGPEKKYLMALTKNLKINNVEFFPTVSKEKIFKCLADADICVAALKKSDLYHYGTSLNKVTDYLAAARPIVLALESPYSPIEEAKAGETVASGNPSSLAAAITRLASLTPEERMQLGLNGREYAQKYYDLKQVATSFIEYLKVLGF